MNENKSQNTKELIALNINTNNINTVSGTNTSDILLDKKNIIKTEIYNNKVILLKPKNQTKEDLKEKNDNNIKDIYYNNIENINKISKERKNSKESFGTIILQKKMKLFCFSNEKENNNNNYTINFKESAISSEKIRNDKDNPITPKENEKKLISIKKLDNDEKKISYKKLKLELIKDNNKYNDENNEKKETLNLETKINKNREILFNSKKEISQKKKTEISQSGIANKEKEYNININKQKIINKSPKRENNEDVIQKKIYIFKTNDNKLNNNNNNLSKKEKDIKDIKLPNKNDKENKNEIDKEKIKAINFKKNISPIKIIIDLDNNSPNYNSYNNNDKFPDKIFFTSAERISTDNKETNIFSLLNTYKNPKTKKRNENENKDFNIETFRPNERKEKPKRKNDKNNNDLIIPLNKMEIFKKNHYKSLFTDITTEIQTKKLNNKKKFKFSERKKNATSKDLRTRLTESNENYFDLYKKAFNDTTSLEQKFSFKPKMNKRYFNYEHNNNIYKNDDENNKTYDNSKKYNKKISYISFNPKKKDKLELNKEANKKELDNSVKIENKNFLEKMNNNYIEDINTNRNAILDLNHFILIDENKLIKTFAKPLFIDKNI